MKTEELISMLASQSGCVNRRRGRQMLTLGIVAAGLSSWILMSVLFGLRPDLSQSIEGWLIWMKLGFAAFGATLAVWLVDQLGRPGRRWPRGIALAWMPVLTAIAVALAVWVQAPAESRSELLFGSSWESCSSNITLLALPFMAAIFVALRHYAPVNPGLVGALAGLAAGALAVGIYSFHCPEASPVFIVVWYGLGALIPVALGFALGRWLLRW